MKKLLSIVLALSFILCASAVFAVSAADESLQDNTGNTKWWVLGNAAAFYRYDPDRDLEFYTKTNEYNQHIDLWAARYKTDITEGSITAVMGPKGDLTVYFGADGMPSNNSVGTFTYWRGGLKTSAISLDVQDQNGDLTSAKLRFHYRTDATVAAAAQRDQCIVKTVELDGATYNLDGTSDITLKIEFTAAGAVKAYVNGVLALNESGYPTQGAQTAVGGYYDFDTSKKPKSSEFTYLKSYTLNTTAPNTGDNTAVYVVASAVVLAATFAVVCISRKKRIAE